MARQNVARRAAPIVVTPATVPVARPWLPTADAVLPYLRQMDEARWYSNFGPLVLGFESRLAARFDSETRIVTCANATQALTLALLAMQLPAGSLVAIPSYTFVATAHAVIAAGLDPYLLDVDAESWMLQPDTVQEALTTAPGAISAVIPVAPFGAMSDLAAWTRFQSRTGIAVLIDAAAAFDLATSAELPLVVSLHATKVLGIGEGGFLATKDARLADRVRQLTTYGFKGSRLSEICATNAKLSEYAGAVGMAAMDAWPHDRLRYLRAGQMMRAAFTSLPEVRFQPGWGIDWVTSVCCVRTPDGRADRVEAILNQVGVETRRWWGAGCHASPAFEHVMRTPLPNTKRLAGSVIGLPFAIDMSADDMGRIAAGLALALA